MREWIIKYISSEGEQSIVIKALNAYTAILNVTDQYEVTVKSITSVTLKTASSIGLS